MNGMTHEEFEALWLESLSDQAADTVDLLGNARKQEREKRTCAAFLRCAGINFNADLIISSTTEPPDVLFNSAHFEITIVLDPIAGSTRRGGRSLRTVVTQYE